mmetsp:Transcript_4417/g.7505  ORF Transcript_4417/g.7505 Transcript_4417/m.7505 type:complete len:185 (+) Transcript_4417:932-1486(+)
MQLKDAIYWMCGDDTFLELYEKNKWNLNITVTDGVRQGDSRLLNYLTAPNVVVWSAAIASCSLPYIFDSVQLVIKNEKGELEPYYMDHMKERFKFVDGSVACDLPLNKMSELFNINTFIVSQVNPHVAPFINSDGYSQGQSRLRRSLLVKVRELAGNELKHWITQLALLGILPQYFKGLQDMVL